MRPFNISCRIGLYSFSLFECLFRFLSLYFCTFPDANCGYIIPTALDMLYRRYWFSFLITITPGLYFLSNCVYYVSVDSILRGPPHFSDFPYCDYPFAISVSLSCLWVFAFPCGIRWGSCFSAPGAWSYIVASIGALSFSVPQPSFCGSLCVFRFYS